MRYCSQDKEFHRTQLCLEDSDPSKQAQHHLRHARTGGSTDLRHSPRLASTAWDHQQFCRRSLCDKTLRYQSFHTDNLANKHSNLRYDSHHDIWDTIKGRTFRSYHIF